jgi:hypothetical protein
MSLMGLQDTKDLARFLQPFPAHTQELAWWLRKFVWELYPNCNELIYDSYNAVAFGWSPTDRLGQTFCSVAVYTGGVHFGFYWGAQIADPEKRLLGKGNQYRFIRVGSLKEFPKAYIRKLMNEAFANSLSKVKDETHLKKGLTIVKSISKKKKRPVA